MKVIALTTSHNRKNTTILALESLCHQSLPSDCELNICLVDDGSIDGTGSVVRSIFPQVIVLDGTGDLFWAGGMRFGWEHYIHKQDFDCLLVFNDDVELYDDAIMKLLAVSEVLKKDGCDSYAIAGAFLDSTTQTTAYGGVVRSNKWHPLRLKMIPPSKEIQECETLNMNCALISREALRLTGFLSPAFKHKRADFDFGLRLRHLGGKVVLAPGYVGQCPRNSNKGTSKEHGISPIVRWRRLTGLKEEPFLERAIYCRRHGGWFWLVFWSTPYLRVWLAWINWVLRDR